jgi:hypothetical protein
VNVISKTFTRIPGARERKNTRVIFEGVRCSSPEKTALRIKLMDEFTSDIQCSNGQQPWVQKVLIGNTTPTLTHRGLDFYSNSLGSLFSSTK